MPVNDPNNYGWLNTLIAFVLTVIGGFTKVIWGRTSDNAMAAQRISDSLGKHKLHLSENYVRKDDFKDFGDRMDKQFDEIKTLIRSGK